RDQETVADAVVVDFEDRSTHSRRLAAYVVPVSDEGVDLAALRTMLDLTTLRAMLADRLPSYMVPSAFVVVERIPLTANGKVDRRALPEPDWTETRGERVVPRNDLEQVLLTMWADVLGLDEADFGVDDDFFALGGHSLLATQVVSRIRHELEVEVALRRLFEAPTVAGLASAVDEAREERPALPPIEALERRPDEDGTVTFPVSFAQERLWFLARLEPDSPAYHIPTPVRLRGSVDLDRLATALHTIVDRHESLRTVFRERDGVPMQVIVPTLSVALPIDEVDEDELATRVADESRTPFDLARGPLLRARIFRLAADDHVLALTVHHIVSDGWSTGVLIRELVSLYGSDTPLAPLVTQVPDIAMWQRDHLAARLDEQIDWWREQLAGVPVLDLPTDHPRPAVQTWAGDSLPITLPARVVTPLDDLARAEGATPFMALLTAVSVVLGRWSGQDDFAIGTPIAGRTRAEMEPLIGFFVNTLALRVDLDGNPSFRTLLGQIRETTLGAYAHQDVPFERLVAALEPDRDPAHPPFFQTAVSLQNAPFERVSLGDDVSVEPVTGSSTTAKYDLVVALGAGEDGGLEGTIEWNTDLFDRSTIERLAAHLHHLVEQAVDTPDLPISRLPLEPSRQRLESIGPRTDYPRDSHLIQQFLGTVQADPDGIALMYEDIRITRAELARRARLQARALQKRGVGWEDPVALFAERSPDMVVSMLAILASGGYYVPLDPTDPDERLTYILDDTMTRVVVAEPRLASRLPAELEVVPLDAWKIEEARGDGEADDAWPDTGIQPESLAYTIYTSGSTGRPKGVTVTHRNVLRLVIEAGYADLGPEQTFSHLASPAFDASVFEIWAPLLGGGRLVLPPPGAMSLEDIGALLSRHEVSTVVFTTGVFHQMVDHRLDDLRGVRRMIIGGEALSVRHARQALAALDATTLTNAYGPTENTCITTCFTMSPGTRLDSATVPIGTPIAHTTVYVLDGELIPTPVGIPGELYTGGDGVARGYLHRPGLTAERFVPDPFATEPGARLYRSGDRARWRADHTVEFLGRVDRQVKLRGFRIEPGEIEAALTSHPDVRAALAMVREDQPGDRRLVAYVVPDAGHTLDVDSVLAHVRPRVPSYMVPAALVALDALPLNRNGKVDRKALPTPTWHTTGERVAPRNEREGVVLAIWAEVLRLDPESFGVEDDFFALGGHSLLATQVVSRLRDTLGVEVPLRRFFEASTVAALTRSLAEDTAAALPPIRPRRAAPARDVIPAPLSFAQERLWFLAQLEPDSPAYHIPMPVRLLGPIDPSRLTAAVRVIVARHEALRTVFREIDGLPCQVVRAEMPFELPIETIAPTDRGPTDLRARIGDELRQPFDLEAGPLLRGRLFRVAEDDHVLVLTVHHIVADGWSLSVLIQELVAFYRDLDTRLEPLTVQVPDVARWQREHLKPRVDEQVVWWRERLAGVPVLELPTDRPRPAVQTWAGDAIAMDVPAHVVEALEALAHEVGGSLFMGLVTIVSAVLARWSGQDDFAVGTPIAGRTRAELEPLIGFFVNTLVLRVDLEGQPSPRELLTRVRDTTLDAYGHQDVPFERLVAELQPERSLSHPPLFQVMVSLQNAPFDRQSLSDEVTVEPIDGGSTTAKFDLQFSFAPEDDGLHAVVEWNTDLFERGTIRRLLTHVEHLLEQSLTYPDRPFGQLALEPPDAPRPVTGTTSDYPRASNLVMQAMAALRAQPESVVLIAIDEEGRCVAMRRGELEARARRMAWALRRRGVRDDTPVAIFAQRSVDMVVAMLAVLGAGGYYVPLDPSDPGDRLAFMLEDTGARVVIAPEPWASRLPDGLEVIGFDVSEPDEETAWPAVDVGPDSLAHIIYTSGSTGRPKGVMVTHRNVLRLVLEADYADLGPDQVFAQLSSPAFDASTLEIWAPLLGGGRLVLPPPGVLALEDLGTLFARYDVSTLWLTAGLFHQMVDHRLDDLRPVRQVLAGGEALSRSHVARVLDELPTTTLINGYGPTENTTFTTCHPMSPGSTIDGATVPIGAPIADTTVHVLDRDLVPTPVGVPGELLTGGDGVTRGYLNRPALTADRYVPDPFATTPGARLYRTGDRVRWLADGSLEFLGRIDRQIKLRGFRIEPGEIEAALRTHPEVDNAVVIVREDQPGDRRLVAYLVAHRDDADGVLEQATLRGYLAPRLPAYMMPAAFVVLDALPLNRNGKVDRRALPVPEWRAPNVYEPPATATEETVAAIFETVLGIDKVGRTDHFFTLGGHSLLATQLVTQIRGRFDIELPLRKIFEAPTVAALATTIDALGDTVVPAPAVAEVDEEAEKKRAVQRKKGRGRLAKQRKRRKT
ncbi:MAG: amino acid adenylation domain-containing protein, partial [Acidobacteriota bacterium]